MKKYLLLILTILLVSNTIFAETFQKGIMLGYNSSKFVGDDLPGKGVSSLPGFKLGGYLTFNVNEKFAVQPEFSVSLIGSQINTFGDEYMNNFFAYFNFPLLIKYTLPAKNDITPFCIFGSSQGLKITAANDTGILEDIRKYDIGLLIGAGVEYKRFVLQSRYYRGLTNFDISEDDINLKNSTLLILFGFRL